MSVMQIFQALFTVTSLKWSISAVCQFSSSLHNSDSTCKRFQHCGEFLRNKSLFQLLFIIAIQGGTLL